jgi:hypothetical protein
MGSGTRGGSHSLLVAQSTIRASPVLCLRPAAFTLDSERCVGVRRGWRRALEGMRRGCGGGAGGATAARHSGLRRCSALRLASLVITIVEIAIVGANAVREVPVQGRQLIIIVIIIAERYASHIVIVLGVFAVWIRTKPEVPYSRVEG